MPFRPISHVTMRLLGADLAQLVRALADHHADELVTRSVLGHDFFDELTVAEHGQAIGDLVNLVKEVGHEQDRHTRITNLAHDLEQILHFVGVKR